MFSHRIETHVEQAEISPKPGVPIIDVIRHGQTEYKEGRQKSFRFDPQASDFALDAEHLDLTEQGIKEIEQATEQIVERADKNNE